MAITINGTGSITGISAGGLPDGVITTDDIAAGAVNQAKRSEQLTLDTAQASTSGTFIDFTGIPSWVKRITVMFNGVSTNGTSTILMQVGTSSGVVSTGYLAVSAYIDSTGANRSAGTSGFLLLNDSASISRSGNVTLNCMGSNIWLANGLQLIDTATDYMTLTTGSITLSGALDRVRITTVSGTDAFDAGSINILYAG